MLEESLPVSASRLAPAMCWSECSGGLDVRRVYAQAAETTDVKPAAPCTSLGEMGDWGHTTDVKSAAPCTGYLVKR